MMTGKIADCRGQGYVLLAALVAALCGCAGGDDTQADHGPAPVSDEVTNAAEQTLFQGTVGSAPSVVGIIFRDQHCTAANCTSSDCTGAIVSRHLVMTAGHCLKQAGWVATTDQKLFSGRAAVTYMDPRDRVFKCLTRTSGSIVGACGLAADGDFVSMTGFVHPSFTGDGLNDTRHDLGFVGSLALTWPGIDQTDSARIAMTSTRNGAANGTSLRVGDGFTAVGYGADGVGGLAGTLRFDPDAVRIDSVGSGVISNTANSVRMCRGDSGSPALILNSPGHPITAGVHSVSVKRSSTDFCTLTGAQQRWAHTDPELSFYQQVMTAFATSCTSASYTVATGVVMNVFECW